VAAKPWRAREAEAALIGAPPSREAFARSADIALADARPSGDNAFKIELARRIVLRTLAAAAEGAPAPIPALPGSLFSTVPGARHVA
jgi:xanthine dehydrogenase YagS FAD-binding subunit